jgi:ketosteroid isomerase-like protein
VSAAPTSIEWIRAFVQRWLEARNPHEADRLLALMTDDIEYRDDSWHKTMRGHADVREFIDATWRATPDMTFELLAGPT